MTAGHGRSWRPRVFNNALDGAGPEAHNAIDGKARGGYRATPQFGLEDRYALRLAVLFLFIAAIVRDLGMDSPNSVVAASPELIDAIQSKKAPLWHLIKVYPKAQLKLSD